MKRTIIDMTRRTEHHVLSGTIFPIDGGLERIDGNIYLARNFINHTSIARVRSILLPRHHVWALFFDGFPNSPPHCQCYLHMARILDQGETITVEDLYLDVLVDHQREWQVVDIDEFRRAWATGELAPDQIGAALEGLENACRFVTESHGDVEPYLRSKLSIGVL
jgi:hypothetical protein